LSKKKKKRRQRKIETSPESIFGLNAHSQHVAFRREISIKKKKKKEKKLSNIPENAPVLFFLVNLKYPSL
jgi:hypothetical protein